MPQSQTTVTSGILRMESVGIGQDRPLLRVALLGGPSVALGLQLSVAEPERRDRDQHASLLSSSLSPAGEKSSKRDMRSTVYMLASDWLPAKLAADLSLPNGQ